MHQRSVTSTFHTPLSWRLTQAHQLWCWDKEGAKMTNKILWIILHSPASLRNNPQPSRAQFAGCHQGVMNTWNWGWQIPLVLKVVTTMISFYLHLCTMMLHTLLDPPGFQKFHHLFQIWIQPPPEPNFLRFWWTSSSWLTGPTGVAPQGGDMLSFLSNDHISLVYGASAAHSLSKMQSNLD